MFPFLPQCVLLYFSFSLSLYASSFPPSFPNALSFHYIALLHRILTNHFYLTPFHFRHLLPFTSEEGGGRNLLSCGLHCLGHFLMNAVDKTTVFQLMRMQQAIPGLKHPSPLSSTLLILTSFWMPQSTMIRFLPSSGWLLPLGRWLTASWHHYCDPLTSSLVLGPTLRSFSFFVGPWVPTFTIPYINLKKGNIYDMLKLKKPTNDML